MYEAAAAAASVAPVSPVFVAGLSARHDADVVRLRRVFDERPVGFAPADLIARIEEAFAARGEPTAPLHDAVPTVEEVFAPQPAAPAFDPIEAARQEGYAAGYSAAAAVRDKEIANERALIEGLASALRSDDRIDRERITRQLRQTVLHLVSAIVGETGVSPDLLAERVEAAAELLADDSESAVLRINPADVALLDGRLPPTIFAVGDAQIGRGAFVLEAASTIVEDGPELWLEQLTAALDKVAVPPVGRAA